jgi:hypothetical protein
MSGARPRRDAVVTIKIPFTVRKRGGRKLVLASDGAPIPPAAPHVDSTLVKAIARAFRWQKMLETGRYATIREIARAEKINPSYVSRVLRLTLLAPATVKAIVDGQGNAALTLAEAMAPFPVEWARQSHGRAPSRVTTATRAYPHQTGHASCNLAVNDCPFSPYPRRRQW